MSRLLYWLRRESVFSLWFVVVATSIIAAFVSQELFTGVWLVFLCGFVSCSLMAITHRKRAMIRFAKRMEFKLLDHYAARTISLDGTSFAGEQCKIDHAMIGQLQSVDTAVFDLSFERGKADYRQTIVAFRRHRGLNNTKAMLNANGSFYFEIAGDWLFGYMPDRLIRGKELDGWCLELLDHALRSIREPAGLNNPEMTEFFPERSGRSMPMRATHSQILQES